MGQRVVPPPSPAVLEAAKARNLGEFVRGYTAAYRTSEKPPPGKAHNAGMFVLVLAAAALPLALALLVVWWLGVVLIAVFAVGLTVWLRKPIKHVFEFRAGLVGETKDGVDAIRWDEVAAVYQDVSQMFVNGVYGSTNHSYRLVKRTGGHVHVGGSVNEQDPAKSLTDVDELGAVLTREIPERHLQTVVDTLNRGGEVRFDKITITQQAITTPDATTPWHEVRDLAAGGGHIALHTTGRKPWQLKIAEIPNFPIFWRLAKELQSKAHQR